MPELAVAFRLHQRYTDILQEFREKQTEVRLLDKQIQVKITLCSIEEHMVNRNLMSRQINLRNHEGGGGAGGVGI